MSVIPVRHMTEENHEQAKTSSILTLLVDNPIACVSQPVTLGIPLPRGVLVDAGSIGLVDGAGRTHEVQTQPLARWNDGSVKWLLLDFVLRDEPAGRSVWKLGASVVPTQQPSHRLQLEQTETSLTINTGSATFEICDGKTQLLRRVILDGTNVLEDSTGQILLNDSRGRRVSPRVERVEVETRGPVRATVRLEGSFPGWKRCRFVARMCFYAGTGLMRLRLTVHNPQRARHHGGLWDLGDEGSALFRELALEFGLNATSSPVVSWSVEEDQQAQCGSDPLEIYQDSSGGENWQSRNHLNRQGQIPCTFRGYRSRHGNKELCGHRATPIVQVSGDKESLTVAVPEFWQQFPKALEVRGSLVRIGLFPHQFSDLFELQGGEQKTHTVWLNFGSLESTSKESMNWVHHPAIACAEPTWYATSGVVPHIAPSGVTDDRLDLYLRDALEGNQNLFARREIIDEYGWRNFGEVYADHEGEFYTGSTPVISHYNNQYDQVHGMLLQFWRTGDRRWFALADPLARHVIDIDIYHTNEDRAAYNGGLFWFTDHYKDAATCTHRTYSRANCQPGDRSYGGGPGGCHNFTTGLLHYYYQTGEPLAREAVMSLADWVVGMDDGQRNLFGLLDDGPTGLASSTAEEDYHGPGRGPGLSIFALLDGWLVSAHRGYLDKAEELIRRCVHPADDIAARKLFDVEKRWSYTVFFSALEHYLRLKAESEELDFMYAYAQASLMHYTSWMLDNERPYLDGRDNLEYPTEAWAGQEFRKANVLRLAAAHCDEPLRDRLLRRGKELADRAWSDLLGFDTRYSARALALLMVEGTRDNFFHTHAINLAARSPVVHDFGNPTTFVPQKNRIRAQLRSLSGTAHALLRLASPRRWSNLIRRR